MTSLHEELGPDWDQPLTLTLTPAMLIHSLFGMAQSVHTGAESCVNRDLVVNELLAVDERTGNHVRMIEQEYVEDGGDDSVWHDWAVEIRIGRVWITGHWQQPVSVSPMEWDWCGRQAEQAFRQACVLIGKQVRPGLMVLDDSSAAPPESQGRKH